MNTSRQTKVDRFLYHARGLLPASCWVAALVPAVISYFVPVGIAGACVFAALAFIPVLLLYGSLLSSSGGSHWTWHAMWDSIVTPFPSPVLTPQPVFFFSYLRDNAKDRDDPLMRRFYADLEATVRQTLGTRADCGFRDRASIRLGTRWRIVLAQALNSCRTLIAVCSPGYYKSEMCTWELSFVDGRAALVQDAAGLAPIITVIWIPGGNPPSAILEIHYDSDSLPADYLKHGLRHVMQRIELPEMNRIYWDVVETIARAVLQARELPSYSADTMPWPRTAPRGAPTGGLPGENAPHSEARVGPSNRLQRAAVAGSFLLLLLSFVRGSGLWWAEKRTTALTYEFRRGLVTLEMASECLSLNKGLRLLNADQKMTKSYDDVCPSIIDHVKK